MRPLLSPQRLNRLSSYRIQILSRNQETLNLIMEKHGDPTTDLEKEISDVCALS